MGQLHNVRLVCNQPCWREEDSVNNVGNTIGCHVVCTNNRLEILAIRTHVNTFASLVHMHWLALNRVHSLEEFQVCGQHSNWQDVVCQDVNQLILVLWLQQGV